MKLNSGSSGREFREGFREGGSGREFGEWVQGGGFSDGIHLPESTP